MASGAARDGAKHLQFEPLEKRTLFSASAVFPAPVPGSVITGITPHTWVADSNGLYQAVTDLKTDIPVNLAQEWQGYYQTMLKTGGASLTPVQRLEGNAEAVFENTGLKNLSAADQARDREDAQREFDAIAAALQTNGTNLNAPLTEEEYIWLGKTIQDNSELYELGLQGHGLNDPPAVRYNGYTNDFQNNVDNTTLFVGGGLNNDQKAVASFFDDSILTHLPFPVVVKNGNIVQLNQNGDRENSLLNATAALDDYMYGGVLTAIDFSSSASSSIHNTVQSSMRKLVEQSQIDLSAAPSNGQIQSLLGTVSTTLSARSDGGLTLHAWTADASGQFFTTTDLAAEWKGYYQEVLAGTAGSLTPLQRLEANAEAVIENTKLAEFDPAYLYLYRQDCATGIRRHRRGTATRRQPGHSRQSALDGADLSRTGTDHPVQRHALGVGRAGTRTERPARPPLSRVHQ